MNEEKIKKADNFNLETSQKIKNIDTEIETASISLKKLDDLHESLININKSFDRCFSILQESIKSKIMTAKLDDMTNKNIKFLNKLTDSIEKDKKNIQKKLNSLMEEKEKNQKKSYDKKIN